MGAFTIRCINTLVKFRSRRTKTPFGQLLRGQVFSQIGENASRVPFAWIAMGVLSPGGAHVSTAEAAGGLGFLWMLQALPPLLFGGIYGSLLDRVNKIRVMFWADIARGLLVVALPFLSIFHALSPAVFYTLVFMTAVFSGIFGPAMMGTVPELAAFEPAGPSLGRLNAHLTMTGALGSVVGPVLGGVLIALAGAPWALALTGTTFFVSALTLAPLQSLGTMTPHESFKTALKLAIRFAGTGLVRGARIVATNYRLSSFIPAQFLFGLSLGTLQVAMTAFLTSGLNLSSDRVGLIWSLAGAGGVVGLWVYGRSFHVQAIPVPVLVPFLFLLSAIPLGMVGLADSSAGPLLALFIAELCLAIVGPAMATETQTHVGSTEIGRVLTFTGTLYLAGFIVGLLVTKPLLVQIGLFPTLALVALFRIVVGVGLGLAFSASPVPPGVRRAGPG